MTIKNLTLAEVGEFNLAFTKALQSKDKAEITRLAATVGIEISNLDDVAKSGELWEASCSQCGKPELIPVEEGGYTCTRCDEEILQELMQHEQHLHAISYYIDRGTKR